jgi:predicted lysophospholipase L1 biosynthesis ABC-type transport system permease subunit
MTRSPDMGLFKPWAFRLLVIALTLAVAVIAAQRYATQRYAAGVQDGRNAILADDARAAAQAQQVRDQLAAWSAAAGAALQSTLGTQLPTLQGQTHDTLDTIRTIYRDRPVVGDRCSRPDGVQTQLDAAVDRANAAVTASGDLRPDPAAQRDAKSAATP